MLSAYECKYRRSNIIDAELAQVLVPLVDAVEQAGWLALLARVDDLGRVLQHHLHQFLGHRSRVVHAWTHVDLNQPRIQVLVNHEVVPNQLSRPLLADDMPLAALDAPDHNIFHLLLNDPPLLEAQPLRELPHLPHRLLCIVLLGVLLDAVVGQVREPVVDVVEGVLVVGEAQVALLVEPDARRREVLDGHPLADVEFTALDQEGIFDVFLDDELGGLTEAVVSDVIDVVEAAYSSSSGHD